MGARYFWTSDFSTHHRATWGASLKAHGNNTLWTVVGGECDNSENILGEHEGDGVLSVYGNLVPGREGREYVTEAGDPNAIFPLLDWQALNGITAEHSVPVEVCGSGDVWPVRNTHFVGAACDGMYTAFAMDTASHNLTAHRSFFFFDNVIIATGSDITDPAPVNVRTALASRILPSQDPLAVAFVNGSIVPSLGDGAHVWPASTISWLAAGGIGYVPLGGDSSLLLGTSVGTATGNWRTIGPYSGTSQARFLQAHLDHSGGGEMGAHSSAYVYAILPAVANADMPAAAAALGGVDRRCITNTPSVAGAADAGAGVTQVVFYAGGTFACSAASGWNVSVASPSAAIVIVREGGGEVAVWAAHPFVGGKSAPPLRITVNRVGLKGTGCVPAAGGTTFVLPLPVDDDARGSTVSVTCA